MENGDETSLREIREVDRGGDYRRNNNYDGKRNGNNNYYNCSATSNNRQPEKAPLVGWRNGSPTICPSSVQNSAYVDFVRLDPTHEEELTDTATELSPGTPSSPGTPLVCENRSKLEAGERPNERLRDPIDPENLLKPGNCSIAVSEEKARKKPKVPDGGWGWMVVLASLVISMIADGVSFSFGLLYIEFLHEFGASKSKTAWIGSLFMAVPLLSGPIMSALVDRYGCRKMTIAGGLISGVGFILSSFGRTIEMMYLTFGVIAGLGLGLCYVTAVVSIAYWFDKKRTLAVGLGACGTGIGTFVYAPMTTYFIQEYGWRGTCLLLAGTFFNMIVAGAVMRDPEWWILEQRKHDQEAPKKSHGRSDDIKPEAIPSDEFPGVDELRRLLRSDHVPEYFVQSLNTTTAATVGGDANRKMSFRSVVNLPTFVKRSEKVPLEALELLLSNSRLYTVILENYPSLLLCRSSSDKQLHDSTGEIPNKSGITMSMRLKRATESKAINEQSKDSRSSPPQAATKPARKMSRKESEEMDPLMTKDVALTIYPTEKPKPALKRNIGNEGGVIRTDSLPWLRRQFSTNTHYFKDIRVHRNSVMYRGAVLNLRKYRLRASSCPDIYTNSMITLAKENEQKWYDELVDLLKGMLDFSMFVELHFLLLSLSTILLFTWFIVPYFYLAEHLTRNSYTETDGANLLGIIGITNTVGMVALGWAGDQPWMNVSKTYTWCLIACGTATILISIFTYHYTLLVASSAAFGLFFASNFSFTPVILVQLIPLERFTTAYGLTLLCQGIGNLLGPPLAGWFFDVTNSWDLSFFMAGGWIIVSGILIGLIPYTKNRKIFGNGPVEMERTNGSDCLV
ncbi:PREDICTED: monocarboxylate transporter 5-like [Dinoponera quadriceps]|uniref:Monocarboxylate transporter 5-like n=1 Tax=Dinoponera quadriceps TaxID=609295 RepID=A0A6P3XLE9_DINQU|nr:PREDICTED: monocarboxylate transporter 5-like [Dinoponera quadriceps]XP_014478800.1 PREDICTED: monocarboxylate transporter 5-like [Dinoponera quadriceps]XP_014478801.1 PREDICTED: monocarboxylate transporter 5-like [Dinoponera quadriceps]